MGVCPTVSGSSGSSLDIGRGSTMNNDYHTFTSVSEALHLAPQIPHPVGLRLLPLTNLYLFKPHAIYSFRLLLQCLQVKNICQCHSEPKMPPQCPSSASCTTDSSGVAGRVGGSWVWLRRRSEFWVLGRSWKTSNEGHILPCTSKDFF